MVDTHDKNFLSIRGVERLPSFIRTEHTGFVQFIEGYFEWMEERSWGELSCLLDKRDINGLDDETLNIYYDQFLQGFPKNIEADKSLFLRLAYFIYQSKGSEQSYETFFRAVFNETVEFYYPKEDILRASDGKYVLDKSIRVDYNVDFLEAAGNFIRGTTSEARAVIEETFSYFIGSNRIVELYLSRIEGDFVQGETIVLENDVSITSTVFNVLADITIVDPGTGYAVEDEIVITSNDLGLDALAEVEAINSGVVESVTIDNGGTGYVVGDLLEFSFVNGANSASGNVKAVDGSGAITEVQLFSKGFNYLEFPTVTVDSVTGTGAVLTAESSRIGGIKTIIIKNFGLDYNVDPTLDISASGNGDAVLEPVIQPLAEYPGRWRDNDGFLSDRKFLIDSFFYQDFSYVLRTNVPIEDWEQDVRKLIHPAGLQLFGEQVNNFTVDLGAEFAVEEFLKCICNIFINWQNLDICLLTDEQIENLDSLGMTFELFDLYKCMFDSDLQDEDSYHFHEQIIRDFGDSYKRQSFPFFMDPDVNHGWEDGADWITRRPVPEQVAVNEDQLSSFQLTNAPDSSMKIWLDSQERINWDEQADHTVTRWKDKTYFKNHFLLNSGVPTQTQKRINDVKVIEFDSGDSFSFRDSIVDFTSSEYQLFLVYRSTNTTGDQNIIKGEVASVDSFILSHNAAAGNISVVSDNATTTPATVALTPDTDAHIIQITKTATDLTLRFDNLTTTVTDSSTIAQTLITLGDTFDGEIGELIVYDKNLTEPNRLEVVTYLQTKYGITF